MTQFLLAETTSTFYRTVPHDEKFDFVENNSKFDQKIYKLFKEKSGFLGVILVLSG